VIQDEAAAVESAEAAPSLKLPAPKRRAKVLALASAALAVAVGAFAFFSFRTRHDPAQGRAAPLNSVAVLPLKNLSGDAEGEYLSDGITESLITSLSRVGGLKVISRGSAFAFKGREMDAREVGRLLGVASVLEGSVR